MSKRQKKDKEKSDFLAAYKGLENSSSVFCPSSTSEAEESSQCQSLFPGHHEAKRDCDIFGADAGDVQLLPAQNVSMLFVGDVEVPSATLPVCSPSLPDKEKYIAEHTACSADDGEVIIEQIIAPAVGLADQENKPACSFHGEQYMNPEEQSNVSFGVTSGNFVYEQYVIPPSDIHLDDFSKYLKRDHSENLIIESSDEEEALEPQTSEQHPSTSSDQTSPLYENAPITINESLIAILTFAQTEKLSGVALQGLLGLISLHLPTNNRFSSSVPSFFKSVDVDCDPILLSFYCNTCLSPRTALSDLCEHCINEDRCVEHFVHKSVGPQISKLFEKPGFSDDISYKFLRQKKSEENIEDIYDSSVYRETCDTDDSFKITLMWNTDGIAPYDSSPFSLWPFYLAVNELPPEKRFRKENMVLAGLWGSRVKPHPNVFLTHLFKEMKILKTSGLTVTINGASVVVKVYICFGTCDSPAKALFLNLKLHSGYNSCPKCLAMGEKSERTSDVLVFPYEEHMEMRCTASHVEHVTEAVTSKTDHLGVKGPTILNFMVEKMIESTAIDSMHCLYSGVMKQIFNLLFNSKLKKCSFSVSKRADDVNKLLAHITLPHFVERSILPVDKLSYMKASLLRNFFFHVSLAVLKTVMDDEHFDNLKMLISGVALLNSESISEIDIFYAEALLCEFVKNFELLYGVRNMSHNIHLVRHLSSSVCCTGPLWATNCFGFESLNGALLTLIHGNTYASLQVYSNLNLLTELPCKITKLPDGPVKFFCEKQTHKYKRYKINEKLACNSFSVGKYFLICDDDLLTLIYSNSLLSYNNPGCRVFSFDRVLIDGKLVTTDSYKKGSRVSCYVQYQSIDKLCYGKVLNFIKSTNCLCVLNCKCIGQFHAVLLQLKTEFPFVNHNVQLSNGELVDIPISHIMNYSFSNVTVIPLKNITTVCFHFRVLDVAYISAPLNGIELE